MTTDDDRIRDVTRRLFHALEIHRLPQREEIDAAREKLRRALRRIPDDLPIEELTERRDKALKRFEAEVAPFV
jgi:hypothetical protein